MINQWQDYGVLDCSNGTDVICVAADGEALLKGNGIDADASALEAHGSTGAGRKQTIGRPLTSILFSSGYAATILWLLIPFCHSALKSSPTGSVSWRVLSLPSI